MLLHAQRRHLGEGRGLDPAYPSRQNPAAAPMLDRDLGAGTNFNGLGAEHVRHDFEVARIADFHQRHSRLHHRLALLQDPQYYARNRRLDAPGVGLRIHAFVVAAEQRHGLGEFVLRCMILEFCGAHVAIGDPLCEFGAFQRLHRGRTAPGECAGAVEFGFGVIGLGPRAFDERLGTLQRGLGSAEPFLGLATGARVEQGRRRRQDRCNDCVGGDMIAFLQPDARQTPGERGCHHIPLADAGLAVLIDAGDEAPLGDGHRLDRDRLRHQKPGDARGRSQCAQRHPHTTCRDTHRQSLVFSTATRSR